MTGDACAHYVEASLPLSAAGKGPGRAPFDDTTCATTVEEARWLEARGVDAIIAQGVEAAGHRGMFLSDDFEGQPGLFALFATDC